MCTHFFFALEGSLVSLDKSTQKLKVNEFPGATVDPTRAWTLLRSKIPRGARPFNQDEVAIWKVGIKK